MLFKKYNMWKTKKEDVILHFALQCQYYNVNVLTVWLWTGESRLTWPRIHLLRTLDHRAAGQTGQHHGCHYLIHLNRLRAAETRRNMKNVLKVKFDHSPHQLDVMFSCPLPVWSLSSRSQLAPAVASLPLLRTNRCPVVMVVAFPQHFLCLDAVLCINLQGEKKKKLSEKLRKGIKAALS